MTSSFQIRGGRPRGSAMRGCTHFTKPCAVSPAPTFSRLSCGRPLTIGACCEQAPDFPVPAILAASKGIKPGAFGQAGNQAATRGIFPLPWIFGESKLVVDILSRTIRIQLCRFVQEISMKAFVLSLLLASTAAFPISAVSNEQKQILQQQNSSANSLAEDIDMAEWSLRHSSVSKAIPSSVLDVSIAALNRARQELAAGNVRTARDILQRASQPLSSMSASAMSGRHPNDQGRILETRQTLESIIDAAARIAAEKKVPDDFVARARDAVRQSDALLAAGNLEDAGQILERAYDSVSKRIAELRSGESFYIPAPAGATDAQWRDGLRRIEERREITRYILIEARADGLDVSPLEQGAKAAEALVGNATAYAGERRWDLALAALNRAYVEYEQSWRAVGVEW